MKKVKLIEVKSEIGAGTRGASLGIDALKIACLNKKSDYFKRFDSTEVPHLNHVLFHKDVFPYAHHIDSVLTMAKSIAESVSNTLNQDMFPLVLSGDHSNAIGTIAGIKKAYPDKTLGVIWIDAHADIHSPFTTPSGNTHGMSLAASISEDNLECQVNEIDAETAFFWNALKRVGGVQPKLQPEHIVYIMVRDTEEQEDHVIKKYGIHNFDYDTLNRKGARQIAAEALEVLSDCDLIYVSFDVDSLDSRFSKGTGTPVERGLDVEQAMELNHALLQSEKIICFEVGEINPTLDSGNTMADNAFRILEHTTKAITSRERLDLEAVYS